MTCWRARLAPLGLALVLFTAASCKGGPERPVFGNAPVILVSIDTLRSDRLPVYGYGAGATPAIDALAKDAILFERAYSHYPLTLPSHASILSGLLPPAHGVRDNVGYPFDGSRHATLARLFKAGGYDTAGMVSAYVLRRDTGIASGFDTYEDGVVAAEGQSLDAVQRPGNESTRLAIEWLRRRGSRPFFLFLHLYEPHAPYSPPPPFAGRFADPYDGEVAAADDCVGRLLGELRALELYDRSIIVLLSDHGEALGDHGGQTHGVFLYREALQIPLLVKLPDSLYGSTRVAAPARLVDVFPTLLGLTGLDAPANDGASLLELLSPDAPPRAVYSETFYPRIHFGWSDLASMVDGSFHYIAGPDPELFAIGTDPRELHNVLARERPAGSRLRQALASFDRSLAPPSAADEETTRRLAALGYLSGASAPTSGPLPDPKTQMSAIRTMERAFDAFDHGDYESAASGFLALVEANPRMTDIWSRLGLTLQRLGRHEEAIAAYETAGRLGRGVSDLELPIALSLIELGRLELARPHAERARASDPRGAFDALMSIAVAQHDLDAARTLFDQARAESAAAEPLRRRYALGLVSAGHLDEALEVLEDLAAAHPEDARTHALIGTLLVQMGRVRDAEAALRRALALDDSLPAAWNSLGLALVHLRRPSEALAAWQRAVALDPDDVESLFNIGLVAHQLGRAEESREALRNFVAHAPAGRYGENLRQAKELLQRR
jgi:arylsulfatase A-like enzyme/Flp pilus assembly protein TadD